MTILAGIFARNTDYHIDDSTCHSIANLLSRNPKDKVISHRDDRCFLAKIDIGAFGASGFIDDTGQAVSLLTGEPIFVVNEDEAKRNREQDLSILHQSWCKGEWQILVNVRGVFCAVHYQRHPSTLTLISDKLGIRSLYYWACDDYMIFATALRILEGLKEVPKVMDLQAVTEIATLGAPLSTRTPYASVSLLKAAEIIQFTESAVSHSQYWRWDELPVSHKPEREHLREAYKRFNTAIDRRLQNDTATFGFLSGGLDSRCVIAGLREKNILVTTFNTSPPNTQDQVFGAEIARRLGTIHHEIELSDRIFDNYHGMLAALDIWNSTNHSNTQSPERPLLGWTGDGGSVGVGHVYLSKAVVDLVRAGKVDEAIDSYLSERNLSIPRRLLKNNVWNAMSNALEAGIRQELQDIRCDDPGRGFHLFHMLNDQRRHFSHHYEDIDQHHFEINLPFFDSYFLESVLAVPIDLCLYHRFYGKWLEYFPADVTSVPWQTYLGHEPCPLPIPERLDSTSMWDSNFFTNIAKDRLLKQASEMIRDNSFPYQILNRTNFHLATWLYRLGWKDYSYVIKAAQPYCKYWALSNGKYSLQSFY